MIAPTQALVDFTLKTDFAALPEPVVRQGKRLLLDSLGCALAGRVTKKAGIINDFIQDEGGKAQARIIGRRKTSYPLATFTNAELISALDHDALGPITGHVAPYVIPPCLAAGEKAKASGKEFITAIVLAHEIGGRILTSMAQRRVPKAEPPYWEDSPRFSFSPTVFGGVAGACKLLRLDGEAVANAFGIAGASAPVPASQKWEHITTGPGIMVKYNSWAGWTAQLATVAALLAEKGFTGDTTILDGDWGFWKIVGSPFFQPEKLIGGLGQNWHLDEVIFKEYPCCNGNQTGIEAITRIMQEGKIKPEDIQDILVLAAPVLLCPCREGTEMKESLDTEFLNAYLFAVAAYLGGKPGPEWHSAATAGDPGVNALMKRVRIALHPKAARLPAFTDVTVEITAGGKKFTAEVEHQKGSPKNPMTDDELKDKFRTNAYYSLGKSSRVEKIIESIDHLEDLASITELTRLLTPAR